jgi:hypothetical protein
MPETPGGQLPKLPLQFIWQGERNVFCHLSLPANRLAAVTGQGVAVGGGLGVMVRTAELNKTHVPR